MIILRYDGTFPGLLTAIFHSYENKEWPNQVIGKDTSEIVFGETLNIETDETKATRVWEGIKKIGGMLTCEQLFHAFLSGDKNIEMLIFDYLRILFNEKRCISTNLAIECVLRIDQLGKKVMREAHRMLMFARFEQTADGIWFAPLDPKYDVIPLITGHFRLRFANQPWLLYDTNRSYGFYFDKIKLEQITIDNPLFSRATGKVNREIIHPDEQKWQEMWKSYFNQIAIVERKNLKCQQNFMPKRFWKYLTEKKI